jgi:CBS domain-containing protein
MIWSLIVERDGLAVGMVTDRDILRRCAVLGRYPDEAKVEKIAGSPIITARPDATAGEAMRTMIDSNVRRSSWLRKERS